MNEFIGMSACGLLAAYSMVDAYYERRLISALTATGWTFWAVKFAALLAAGLIGAHTPA